MRGFRAHDFRPCHVSFDCIVIVGLKSTIPARVAVGEIRSELLYSSMEELQRTLHVLVESARRGLVGGESSGSLGIPSRTSSFGRQMNTLERHRMQRERETQQEESFVSTFTKKKKKNENLTAQQD